MDAVLGIDAGGSSSRWLVLSLEGATLGRGQGAPLTGHVLSEAGRAENLARLRDMLAEAQAAAGSHRLLRVMAGVTGLQRGSEAARLFTVETARRLGLAEDAVSFAPDIEVAYRSALEPGAGVLVYAGTGSVAYHMTANGDALRAGGHGYLVDDAGGGYWIGREGLKAVLREADRLGRPPETPLAEAVYGAVGSRDWPDIFAAVYGGGKSRVAALAPAVGQAERAGDPVAAYILEEAGRELARLAQVLLARVGAPLPVAFVGGVARLGEPLVASLRADLPPGTPFTLSSAEPVEAAARLALGRARQQP